MSNEPPRKRLRLNTTPISSPSKPVSRVLFGKPNNNTPPSTPPRLTRNIMPLRNISIDPTFYQFDRCIHLNGQWYHVTRPDTLYAESFNESVAAALPKEEIASMEDLLIRPGIYTWILGASKANITQDTFYARRALTPGEIISKHKNIMRNVNATSHLVLAGEVQVHPDGSVDYNFLSGSFMPKVMRQQQARYGFMALNKLQEYMDNKWSAAGATEVRFNPSVAESSSLITGNTTNEAMAPYLAAGYTLSAPFANEMQCTSALMGLRGGSRTKKIAKRRRNKTRARH